MREILTGVLQGTEDTRAHILHVMRSSMQNGVKLPRVLIIKTWHPWEVSLWYLVMSKSAWANAKANSHVSWHLKVPPRMGVNPRGSLRSPERNPGTILMRPNEYMQVYPCTKCIRDMHYSSNKNPVKSKALKEVINSCNSYIKLRYKKAPWITTIDQT